jgi:16S rRNA (cytosine967-C5)-methyltransferase
MTSVRLAAAEVLLAVGRGRTTLAAELERARAPLTDRRDRALLVELTAGTLRWRNALDAIIQAASTRPPEHIDPRALAVLRVGVYQLRHLTRVPAHAVLHESVENVRALGAPRAASFVNAVLRSVTRGGARLELPRRPAPDAPRAAWVRYLTVSLSHPAWLVERWLDRYGVSHTLAWCEFNNSTPSVVVRPLSGLSAGALTEALQSREIAATPARHVSDAVTLPPGALGRLPIEHLERLHVQDEGSQLVARVANARPGERVLDACASPGGKTIVMAADMAADETRAAAGLVASDHRAARVRLLADTLRRAGLGVPIVRLDARRPLPFGPVFDAVLVDAPCSGLGTLSRDPDLKWARTPDQLDALAADQRRLIRSAAEAVRPGGRLIYATCSSEPEENLAIVEGFAAEDPRFELQPIDAPGVPRSMIDDRGCLMTFPFRDGIDAFFAARLVRRRGP